MFCKNMKKNLFKSLFFAILVGSTSAAEPKDIKESKSQRVLPHRDMGITSEAINSSKEAKKIKYFLKKQQYLQPFFKMLSSVEGLDFFLSEGTISKALRVFFEEMPQDVAQKEMEQILRLLPLTYEERETLKKVISTKNKNHEKICDLFSHFEKYKKCTGFSNFFNTTVRGDILSLEKSLRTAGHHLEKTFKECCLFYVDGKKKPYSILEILDQKWEFGVSPKKIDFLEERISVLLEDMSSSLRNAEFYGQFDPNKIKAWVDDFVGGSNIFNLENKKKPLEFDEKREMPHDNFYAPFSIFFNEKNRLKIKNIFKEYKYYNEKELKHTIRLSIKHKLFELIDEHSLTRTALNPAPSNTSQGLDSKASIIRLMPDKNPDTISNYDVFCGNERMTRAKKRELKEFAKPHYISPENMILNTGNKEEEVMGTKRKTRKSDLNMLLQKEEASKSLAPSIPGAEANIFRAKISLSGEEDGKKAKDLEPKEKGKSYFSPYLSLPLGKSEGLTGDTENGLGVVENALGLESDVYPRQGRVFQPKIIEKMD